MEARAGGRAGVGSGCRRGGGQSWGKLHWGKGVGRGLGPRGSKPSNSFQESRRLAQLPGGLGAVSWMQLVGRWGWGMLPPTQLNKFLPPNQMGNGLL